MAFIDLPKAFDSISREALWKALSRFGCPANFITILRLLHDKMTATALINGTENKAFHRDEAGMRYCTNPLSYLPMCVPYSCPRDPLLREVENDYRLDGRLCNLSRLKANLKVMKTVVIDLQYADDCDGQI